MDLGLTNKAVLVLASSKGLGKATAMKYAEEGARVMITGRDGETLKATAKEIKEKTGSRIEYEVCDITKKEDIKNLVQKTVDAFGNVDVLINNAGGPPAGTFDDFGDEEWEYAFQLTLQSMIRAVREVLPHMRKNGGGRIVNIASSSFKQPIDGLILSNTFRTAIMGLAKSLSQELAKDQILINTIGPGRIGTDRIKELDQVIAGKKGISVEDVKNELEQTIPLGRYGTPEEFARVIVFLGSEANTYVTGQAFLIDGGMVKAF
ncbi:SDR family oxidoreductase [Fictibacillus gelatini]|uniref:SDR family oxidoreductase n=1 Tax=Fictibacillus gelatini TaxID=225985 RepID=UPI00042A090B|nr:SDR family oxidoreductase [Fictibacillus gelatini]